MVKREYPFHSLYPFTRPLLHILSSPRSVPLQAREAPGSPPFPQVSQRMFNFWAASMRILRLLEPDATLGSGPVGSVRGTFACRTWLYHAWRSHRLRGWGVLNALTLRWTIALGERRARQMPSFAEMNRLPPPFALF
jgi:hypothetical protein